jgi:hypothetical protein
MKSQPGPSGSQLTLGGAGSGAGTRGRACDGITRGPGDEIADWASGLARAAPLGERDAVDGVGKGPVSKEQPTEAQPVAAGPTKVGVNSPKLVDVMLGVAFCAGV